MLENTLALGSMLTEDPLATAFSGDFLAFLELEGDSDATVSSLRFEGDGVLGFSLFLAGLALAGVDSFFCNFAGTGS